jgi:hypothetical protein
MPINGKEFLLKVFNKIWTTAFFPTQWIEAIVIHVPKPDKEHSFCTKL